MSLEMSQFHDAFFEEAFESLSGMETALLALNPGTPDAEAINSIFRVAHSIKGGSGMFSFNEITSFTHTLETLLDELRAERMLITGPIIDLLLKRPTRCAGCFRRPSRRPPSTSRAWPIFSLISSSSWLVPRHPLPHGPPAVLSCRARREDLADPVPPQ